MAGKTLYGTLGISTSASQDTIRAAWERLSSQWDPTRPVNSDVEAQRQYAAIQNAYSTLGNAQKRAAYDRKLRAARRVPAKRTRWVLHVVWLALFAGLAASYTHVGKVDFARITTGIKTAAAELVRQKPARADADAIIEAAGAPERHVDGPVIRVELERREPPDSLRLKLETELASRQPLARTPLSQL